jgi:DNA adenine methylase
MHKNNIQKPFLKWVGGKTQIIDTILSKIPKEMNNYHELFLGGGSVLLAILSLQKQNKIIIKNKIFAYDINPILINVYKHIQSNKEELYKYITLYINQYDSIKGNVLIKNPASIEEASTSKKSYYYWMRQKFNSMDKESIECSALFMVINKTCFRGVYREGPNGFNVPYGHYKKTPSIITMSNLNNISELIQDVQFISCDFTISMKNLKEGDFAYLDPPYVPLTPLSFVKYVANGFNNDNHIMLFKEIKNLKNVKFLMSNAKVELVIDNFKDYKMEDIVSRRHIHSKNPGSKTIEVLICNY